VRSNAADTKVREEGGEGAPGSDVEMLDHPLWMVKQVVPLHPREDYIRAVLHMQPWRSSQ